ncbi:MAG TPA: ABC transporter ATP-binding protein, partial [Ktedonobacterales bacterium]|nr:ABC transporter ATP-binding protein [Ktedonobacterales bacterium]
MQIAMQGLTKMYSGKVHALNGVNLTIASGTFGLLGPNGAGKTTLMRILAGILQPTSGSLKINGQEIRSEHDRTQVKRALGYLPQELGLYPDLTAREFLDYIALLKGIDQSQVRHARIDELLELVGLSDVARRKLKAFSGGMKRRVGIAQALLNDPKLLIVDEPTAGLDPEERIRFRNLLADLGGNRVVLLSTHIVEDIAQTCRDLAVLTEGRVIFQGTVPTLLSEANGHVWVFEGDNLRPEGSFVVVSTIPLLSGGMQYR